MSVGGGACKSCGAGKLEPSAAAHDHDNPVSGNKSGTISQLTSGACIQ